MRRMSSIAFSAKRRRIFFFVLGLVAFLGAMLFFIHKASSLRLQQVIVPWSGPGWVMPGLVKQASMIRPGATVCEFTHAFEVDGSTTQPIRVEFEALGESTLSVDGKPFAGPVRGPTQVTMPALEAGMHVLALQVIRDRGPAAFRCRITDGVGKVMSASDGPGWRYTINGSAEAAPVPVSSPWIGDATDPLNLGPGVVWGFPAGTLAVGVLGLAGLVWGYRASKREETGPGMNDRQYWVLVGGVMVGWAVLLVWAWGHVSSLVGFDVRGHLEYIQYVRENWRIPLAHEGWQMYQAPLYYMAAASLLWVVGAPQDILECVSWLHGLNLVLAMAFLVACAGALKGFCGRRTGRAAVGFMLLASCPMSFYVFCGISNENLLTVMVAVFFWVFSCLSRARDGYLWWASALGACLGLALLSKVSGLLLIVPMSCFLGLKFLARLNSTGGARRELQAGFLCSCAALAVSGWYYGYVWWRLGSPVVGNWDPSSGQVWWQLPGLRSLNDYIPSLAPLKSPFFAGLHDVWSGLWSTMAGDALMLGTTRVEMRPGWNDWVFPVSLTAALCLAALGPVGFLRSARPRRGMWRLRDVALMGGGMAGLFAMMMMTLAVPSYSVVKSFYAMIVVLPLCFFASRVLTRCAKTEALGVSQSLGLAAPWVVAFVVMFALPPGGQARSGQALRAAYASKEDQSALVQKLSQALETDRENWAVRIALADILVKTEGMQARVAELIDAPEVDRILAGGKAPEVAWAGRLYVRAKLLAAQDQTDEAISTMLAAAKAGPAMSEPWAAAVMWLNMVGKTEAAREAARQGLVYHPWSPELRAAAK